MWKPTLPIAFSVREAKVYKVWIYELEFEPTNWGVSNQYYILDTPQIYNIEKCETTTASLLGLDAKNWRAL